MTLATYREPRPTRARAVASWPRAKAARAPSRAEAPGESPRFVAELRADDIAARIEAWRGQFPRFDALLREGVTPAQALRRLALTHWSAGDPSLASVMLATSAALAPDDAAVWLDLGHTLQASGDPAAAALALTRAVALDPASARGWLALALVANALGESARAETAFANALARDSRLHDAAFGLGLLCFEQRRYAEAAAHWRAAIAGGCRNAMVHAGLGQSLFFLGDFVGAAEALARHGADGSAEPALRRRHALACYLVHAREGDLASAEAAYIGAAAEHAEPLAAVALSAFHILAGYGYGAAAARIGRERLARGGNDPVRRFLFAAAAGEKRERAPRDFVIAHFDHFAENFDEQLVDVLRYRVPDELADMVAATGRTPRRVADLGCGTGLCGMRLRTGRARLVGVDLSPRMLEKAAARGVYDELRETEMVQFLEEAPRRFDLIFAADALIYLGDLAGFFRAAARAAAPGAILAFNIETTSRAAYRLLPSGRFAHSPKATLAIAAPWFGLLSRRRASPRIEAGKRVRGELMLLERREAPPRVTISVASAPSTPLDEAA